MRKLKLSAIAAGSALMLCGCNTIYGVGEDVSAVGYGVSHVASEVSDEVFGTNLKQRNTVTYLPRQLVNGRPVAPQQRPNVTIIERSGRATAGQLCDPNPELSGGTLPACPPPRRY